MNEAEKLRAEIDRLRTEFLWDGVKNLALFTMPMILGAWAIGFGEWLVGLVMFSIGVVAFTTIALLMRSELRT